MYGKIGVGLVLGRRLCIILLLIVSKMRGLKVKIGNCEDENVWGE